MVGKTITHFYTYYCGSTTWGSYTPKQILTKNIILYKTNYIISLVVHALSIYVT